jgi:hypothetical protein
VAGAIRRLIQDGATVVGPKPDASPSLAGYPHCDAAVAAIAAEVWGDVDGGKVRQRQFGKGTINDGIPLEQVFAGIGLPPDVQVASERPLLCAAAGNGRIGVAKNGGIIFKHRATADREIYFLANTSGQAADFTASLRMGGRKPWLWNADSGSITEAAAFTQRDGRTHIPLHLDTSESIFIVFGESIGADVNGSPASNTPGLESLASLDGPWTVRFDGQGAPQETIFETLTDWAKHPDEAIRHYSGTAVYQTGFTLEAPARNQRTILELGKAAVMATVVVNGREAGILWTTPWKTTSATT